MDAVPERPNRFRILEAAVVLALGVGIGLAGLCREVNPFDEGLVLVGAERVLHGELPFRDFYALYPPGQYYALAGLFGAFDHAVVTLRLYCIVVRALIALLLYLMARRVMGRMMSLACWGASIVWLTSFGFYGYPVFPALVLVLLGLWWMAAHADRRRTEVPPRRLRPLMAGAALGAAALFRHDLAFYGFLASTPYLIALVRKGSAAETLPAKGASSLDLRPVIPYLAGMALAFGIPAILLLVMVPFREVVFELFTYPGKWYALVRGMPYPPLFLHPFTFDVLTSPRLLLQNFAHLPFYAPQLFYALGLAWLAWQLLARRRDVLGNSENLRLASLVLLGALGFNLIRVRADMIHGVVMIVPCYFVAAVLMRKSWLAGRPLGWIGAVAIGSVCLFTLLWPLRYFPFGSARGLMIASRHASSGSAASCQNVGAERAAAAAYLRSVVAPNQRILVGCGRHDKVFTNEPLIYHLAGRLPATRYHSMDPGIVTTLPVQRQIAGDLERHGVEYVVLTTDPLDRREPNLSSVSSGVTYLDDYIRSHYEVARRFGPHLTVWRRSKPWKRTAALRPVTAGNEIASASRR